MNYIILIALALFFIATSIRDGAMGWNVRDGTMNFRIGNGDYSLRVEADGDVDLAPDGSGVTMLDDSFEVTLRDDGTTRRVLYSNQAGAVARQFFVDGDEQPWGAAADAFVAEVMPIVLRESAINADERVAWLIESRGQAGLLDEIDLIRSDFAQRVYTVRYAETAAIAAADFDRLMDMAGEHMSSDFDLRTTLTAVYDAQMPAGESFAALLEAGETISSDFDARTLLEHVRPRMPATPEAAAAYLDVAANISSDFDMRLALTPLASDASAPEDVVARAIRAAATDISSDFDLRTLLTGSVTRVGASDVLARAYTDATGSISSDFDQREALTALAREAQLSPAGWAMLLTSARNISSDFDTATLLTEVAPQLPQDDDGALAAFRATLDTISNDFDRERAAAALERARR
jgi:hypothetical protein